MAPSKYVAEPHMTFSVDGIALDDLLFGWYSDERFLGLVPTTLNWMPDAEQAVVWDRFLDRSAERQVVPILCCPDDLDFDCSVVVVDTRISDDVIEWRAFGFDQTFDQKPDGIGSSVAWLPPETVLRFDRAEFDAVAARFYEWTQTQKAG